MRGPAAGCRPPSVRAHRDGHRKGKECAHEHVCACVCACVRVLGQAHARSHVYTEHSYATQVCKRQSFFSFTHSHIRTTRSTHEWTHQVEIAGLEDSVQHRLIHKSISHPLTANAITDSSQRVKPPAHTRAHTHTHTHVLTDLTMTSTLSTGSLRSSILPLMNVILSPSPLASAMVRAWSIMSEQSTWQQGHVHPAMCV